MTEDVSVCLRTLPRVIKIGAYDWKVVLEEGDGEKHGWVLFDDHTIHLWGETLTSPSHCIGITLHEILHVIYDNEKLFKAKRKKEAREEQIVMGFEAGLVSLLRDNRRLMNWIKRWL